MIVVNQTRNQIIANRAAMADTVISRLVGLLNRARILEGEGLMITHCRSIHMFFMRFAIDVIFVDRKLKVLGLVKNIPPFAMSPYFLKAYAAIELPVGVIEKTGTQAGDQIAVQEQ